METHASFYIWDRKSPLLSSITPSGEFVYSLHYRSGANGVFGRIREGYNANIAGVRYKF